jgi:hypothetical protein
MVDPVGVDLCGRRRVAISALVGCHDVVAGCGQCGDLMPPGMSSFGEPVTKQHEWIASTAGLDHIEFDSGISSR